MIAQENYGEKRMLNLEGQEFRVKSMARDTIKEWDKYDLGSNDRAFKLKLGSKKQKIGF